MNAVEDIEIAATEKFTFFWGEMPFSQWTPGWFTVDGIKYNCAEQYMMAEKARLFNDRKSCNAIMKTTRPAEQKRLGRLVEGFNLEKWNSVARDIVYKGNFAKFTQNQEMQKVLLATVGTTLVEASPYDVVWGIGLTKSDSRCSNRSTWRGTNWLGQVLTRVRDDISGGCYSYSPFSIG